MPSEQRSVLGGMCTAVVTVVVLGFAYAQGSIAIGLGPALGIVLLPLAVQVGLLAKHRFFHADAIRGAAYDAPGSGSAIRSAMLQNTLEQTVLAALAVYHTRECLA